MSKTGISWTMGTRGASVTARDVKLTGNVGLPGTGLSYRKRLDLPDSDPTTPDPQTPHQSSGAPSWLILVIVLAVGIFIGLSIR